MSDLISHVAKVKAARSAYSMADVIPFFKVFKGELRGKNEVILYDWPIFSTLIFDNSFC